MVPKGHAARHLAARSFDDVYNCTFQEICRKFFGALSRHVDGGFADFWKQNAKKVPYSGNADFRPVEGP